MSTAPAVDVLVLCTANLCRSPAAAAVLRSRLSGTGIRVASAGFAARVGAPADERTRRLVPQVPVGFRAQQLTSTMLRDARLVLTMTRQHRAAAVGLAPGTVRRTFTLTEFADLVELVAATQDLPAAPADRLDLLVDAAPRLRGARASQPARPDDVDDPYLLDARGYRDVVEQIVDTADSLAAHVLGAPVPARTAECA